MEHDTGWSIYQFVIVRLFPVISAKVRTFVKINRNDQTLKPKMYEEVFLNGLYFVVHPDAICAGCVKTV
jgi:hypothetical protein